MSQDSPTAQRLAGRVDPQRPQPDLTSAIAACSCPGEVRAGLYLLNGDWDAAHRAAQDCQTPLGAYWHALVHRHEPDYGNSKYWLRRTGAHPVHAVLLAEAERLGHAGQVAPDGAWDPSRFTDCFGRGADGDWTRALDRLEQTTLLAFSLEG